MSGMVEEKGRSKLYKPLVYNHLLDSPPSPPPNSPTSIIVFIKPIEKYPLL